MTSTISDLVEVLSNKQSLGIGINEYPDANGYITQVLSGRAYELKQGVTHRAWINLFSAPNTVQNIKTGVNDKFYYRSSVGLLYTITLPPGFYQVADYNNYIQAQMVIQGNSGSSGVYYITIGLNNPTLQVSITVSNNFTVVFSNPNILPNTIASNYGFPNVDLVSTLAQTITFLSTSNANIFPQDTILITCDLVNGIYYNGLPGNLMEMIPVSVPSGWLMVYNPNPVNKYEVIKKTINQVRIRITDQNNLPILSTAEQIKMLILIEQI